MYTTYQISMLPFHLMFKVSIRGHPVGGRAKLDYLLYPRTNNNNNNNNNNNSNNNNNNNNNNNSRDKWINADWISHHSWSSSQTSSFSFLELAATHRTPPQVTCAEGPGNMLIEFKRFAVNSKADGNNNLWFGSKRYPWQGKVSICKRDFIKIAGQMLLVFSISTYRTALLGGNIP